MSIIKRLEKLGAKSPQWAAKPKNFSGGRNKITKPEFGQLLNFAQDKNFGLGAPEEDSQAISKGFTKGINALKDSEKSRLKDLRSLLPAYHNAKASTEVW